MNSLPSNGNSARRRDEQRKRRTDDQAFLRASAHVQQRQVDALDPAHEQGVLLAAWACRISAASTGISVRVSTQRARHREGDGERHRLEQLAFQPVSENSGRNTTMMIRIAKAIGLATSRAACQHDAACGLAAVPARGQEPEAVLDHHHGAVDHHADADRQPGERHQVGRQPDVLHQDEGDQHRQRQRDDHHHAERRFAEEQEQDDGHQHRAFDQRALGGLDRLVDQLRCGRRPA